MSKNTYYMEILQKIQNREITPAEGKKLLDERNIASKEETKDGVFQGVVLKRPMKLTDVTPQKIIPRDPESDEIQIMILAFGLNFSDLLSVEGMYPNMPEYQFTPGCECAGIIRKVGSCVSEFRPGDAVVCTNNITFGGHSNIVTMNKKYVYRKPENVTFEEISGLTLVFMVNYHMFKLANVSKGDRILIHGAAGGVGHIAVQMAKLRGAEVFATLTVTKEKEEYLKSCGTDHLIDYTKTDFKDRILELTNGYGVDVVINTLTGEDNQKSMDLLAPNGRYLEIAMVGLRRTGGFDLSKWVNNQSFYSIDIGRCMKQHPQLRSEYMEKMIELVSNGQIKPHIDKVFSLNEINKAYKYMKERRHIGKIIVRTGLDEMFIKSEVIRQLSEYHKKNNNETDKMLRSDIAIIGMSGRFGKTSNLNELWEYLESKRDLIAEVPKSRWNHNEYYDQSSTRNDKTNSKWGSFLEGIEGFDAIFFNISGHEAKYMDPQQRIMLEEIWSALEYAGYGTSFIENTKVGVFIGCSPGDYQDLLIENKLDFDAQSFWGTSPAVNAARISYYLNLKGPGMTIDTACSSGANAIYLACQSLWNKEATMAIAGGSFLSVTPKFYLMSGNAGMLSPTGYCHTFDSKADGFVPGEGVGAIILKPLDQAMKDRDPICGIIKGIGSNQDGRTNGLTAPSAISQSKLEEEVYEKFNISPDSISYIEAHGTGTKLGDPIEIDALTSAFRKYTDKNNFCAIGSIKSNIGHTSAAAGMAGVMKVLLSFSHEQIPPTIHFDECNPMIDIEHSPFYVANHLVDWKRGENVRRAAVSSFGFSGSNVHIVLEEPPVIYNDSSEQGDNSYIIPISAKTKTALNSRIQDLYNWIVKDHNATSLKNISYTLQVKRMHFRHRVVFIAQSQEQLKLLLEEYLSENEKNKIVLSQDSTYVNNEQRGYIDAYMKGEEINWSAFYKDMDVHTVVLPSYPFEREKYWINTASQKEVDKNHKTLELLRGLQSGTVNMAEVEKEIEEVSRHD